MWVHVMLHALDWTHQSLSDLEIQRKLKMQRAWWRPGQEKGCDLSYPVLGLEKLTNPPHMLECVPLLFFQPGRCKAWPSVMPAPTVPQSHLPSASSCSAVSFLP